VAFPAVVVVVGVALEVALEVGTESRSKQSLLNMGAAYADEWTIFVLAGLSLLGSGFR
jgi:hypothetical protein